MLAELEAEFAGLPAAPEPPTTVQEAPPVVQEAAAASASQAAAAAGAAAPSGDDDDNEPHYPATALYDFGAGLSDTVDIHYIHFSAGDRLTVVNPQEGEDWWWGATENDQGFFAANYVQIEETNHE
jgi:hypothetical protein